LDKLCAAQLALGYCNVCSSSTHAMVVSDKQVQQGQQQEMNL
jgi:uncharacterized protein YuzB (UPF0349 family)